jgi:hypothetical protein
MNRTVLVCSLLVMTAFVMAQAPAASHAAIEKQIIANERSVNDAFAKGDAKAFHASVSSDAVSIDGSGISKVNTPDFDKMMQSVKTQSWNIDGSQFYWVNDSTIIHMYRWTGKGTYEGQPIPSPTWASTVWTNKGGKWTAAFHQETTAMPAPVVVTAKPVAAPAKK